MQLRAFSFDFNYGRAVILDVTVVIAIGVAQMTVGALGLSNSRFFDRQQVFSAMITGPTTLLVPLVVVLFSCRDLRRILSRRFIASTRTRMSLGRVVRFHTLTILARSASIGFALSFVSCIYAFCVWALLGDPGIEPPQPGETWEEPVRREGLSQLLAFGTWIYAFGFATWTAFCCAVMGAAGAACYLTIPWGALAGVIPFVVFFAETVIAQYLGDPWNSLFGSFIPFGLVQPPLYRTLLPFLIAAAAVGTWWCVIARRLPQLRSLT